MPRITAGAHELEVVSIEGTEPALVFPHEGLGSTRL